MRFRTWLLAAILPLVGTPAFGQRRPPAPAGWTEFGRRFDAYAREQGIVGGSAVLLRDGRVAGRHHWGLADRAAGRPVDDSTLFHWASVTKTLTAIAVLQLRDRGRLSLDDPITRWIPELRRIADSAGGPDRITLRMLLEHASGLQGPTWPWTSGEPWEPFEPTEWSQLVAMMPYQRLGFPPGTAYRYSNPGYIYLARVVEQVSGDPWAVYVQKNIWLPLGLSRSYVGRTPYHMTDDRGHGYRGDSLGGPVTDLGAEFDPGVTIPNSGWNAPIDELARYAIWLMSREDRVLSRRTREEMFRPARATGSGLPEFSDVGLGIFSLEADGRRLVGHSGDQAGYRAFLYLDAARQTGIVLAFNTARDGGAAERSLAGLAQDAIALLRP